MIFSIIYFRTTSYFQLFIGYLPVPYEFWFSYGWINVTFLTSAAFLDTALLRGRHLLKGGVGGGRGVAFSDL